MRPRLGNASIARRRRRLLLLGAEAPGVSLALPSLVAADPTPPTNLSTVAITGTWVNTNGAAMAGYGWTASIGSAVNVDAAACTLAVLEAEIPDDGVTVGNIELYVFDTETGAPMPGIPASLIAITSDRGATDTITEIDTLTDRNGRFRATVTSETAGDPVFSATVDSVAVTDTATVEVTGTPSALTPEFFSDWAGAALGSATTSKNDGGKWTVVGGANGTGVEVVAVTGLDMPAGMVNCLLVPWDNGVFNFLRVDTLDVPALGEHRAYRWYQRYTLPDGTSDTNQHPMQDGNAISQTNWAWNVYNDTTAGEYRTGVQFRGMSWPNDNFFGPNLDKDTTYRIETLLTRDAVDATAFTFDVRVYNDAGVLIADGGDFANASAVSLTTFCASNDLTFNAAANLNGFNAGTNDNGAEAGDWGYQGGVAICDNQGFIGAYGSVTGEA